MSTRNKKYTILILPQGPGKPRRYEIGAATLRRILLVTGLATFGMGVVVVDYVQMKLSFGITQMREAKSRRRAEAERIDTVDATKRSEKAPVETVSPHSQIEESDQEDHGGKGPLPPLANMNVASGGVGGRAVSMAPQTRNDGIHGPSRPNLWPIAGWVSSGFGMRPSPFTGKPAMHEGLDIVAPFGARVIAPAEGRVVFAGEKEDFGRYLIIDHGAGITTHYGHLSAILVSTGEDVSPRAPIGLVGNTGRSTGPHLHYEIRVVDFPVDPRIYLPVDPETSADPARGP